MGHVKISNLKTTIRETRDVPRNGGGLPLGPPYLGLAEDRCLRDSYLQQALIPLYFLKQEHVTFRMNGTG